MKKIKLTRGKKALVDDEDFEKLNKYKWSTTKCSNVFYAVRVAKKIDGKHTSIRMHRVVMNIPANFRVYHINGNCLDNRRKNLRLCTNAGNYFNLINSSSGIKMKTGHLNYIFKKFCKGDLWKIKINL